MQDALRVLMGIAAVLTLAIWVVVLVDLVELCRGLP